MKHTKCTKCGKLDRCLTNAPHEHLCNDCFFKIMARKQPRMKEIRIRYSRRNKAIQIKIPAHHDIYRPINTGGKDYIWWLPTKDAQKIVLKLQKAIAQAQQKEAGEEK